jgi:hypothetical protein
MNKRIDFKDFKKISEETRKAIQRERERRNEISNDVKKGGKRRSSKRRSSKRRSSKRRSSRK